MSWRLWLARAQKRARAAAGPSIHFAALRGDPDGVRYHLDRGVHVDKAGDADGQTALHAAAEGGRVAVARLLLERGATTEVVNRSQQTPLHLAAQSGQDEIVRLLLAHGASVDSVTDRGDQPLHLAAEARHAAVVRTLVRHEADPNGADSAGLTPLHLACGGRRLVIAPWQGRHAKHATSRIVTFLLDQGAQIDAVDASGWTPLHCCAQNGYRDAAAVLLQRGASMEARTREHEMISEPVSWPQEAAQGRLPDVAEGWEMRFGPEPGIRYYPPPQGATPLHIAAALNWIEVAKLLIERGADVNATSLAVEWVPLQVAAVYGHVAMVRLLLEAGAKPNAGGGFGTALALAKEAGHQDVVDLLTKYGTR